MEKETAFWEAVLTLAPLLALTLVVEIRNNRWHSFRPIIRNIFVAYMVICLVFLASTTVTSLLALKHWREPGAPDAVDANVAFAAICLAAFGALLMPINNAIFIAQGSRHPKVKAAHLASRQRHKDYRAKLSELSTSHHELGIEACERILTNPEGVFHSTPHRTIVRVVDPHVVQLREQRDRTHAEFHVTENEYRRWRKKDRRHLKRIDHKHGIRRRAIRLKQEGF